MPNITVPEKYWAECPTCGREVLYERFQYDGGNANSAEFNCKGCCPNCQREYVWREKFVLVNISPLEDITQFDNSAVPWYNIYRK